MKKSELNNILHKFDKINLKELNEKASFLNRIDKKFLITLNDLEEIIKELKNNFYILEIGEKRVFSYENIYMDTDEYLFYNQHQNKENNRTKIRTRLYKDSNLAYFEYKYKTDGITKKFRYEFPIEEHGIMTKGKKRFYEGVWQSIYNTKALIISPSIQTSYKRITLVDKNSKERLTIDYNIKTKDLRNKQAKEIKLKNLVIIESKSMSEESPSAKIFKNQGFEESKACSKYSLGVIYSGLAKRYDTFQETIEKIKQIRLETIASKKRPHVLKVVNINKKEEKNEKVVKNKKLELVKN